MVFISFQEQQRIMLTKQNSSFRIPQNRDNKHSTKLPFLKDLTISHTLIAAKIPYQFYM